MHRFTFILCILSLFVISREQAFAQSYFNGPVESTLRFESILAADANPFWLHSNRFGLYDSESSQIMTRARFVKQANVSKLDYGFGVDALARVSNAENIIFHELYGEVRYKKWRLFAGKREWEDVWWTNDLSIGSMVWSRNAPTLPKITFQLVDYIDIPFTYRVFAFKGYMSHGWFENDRFVENAYLHEKNLYIRFLPDTWPVYFHAGLMHNVQWGGNNEEFGDLPSSFRAFEDVFFARSSSSTTNANEIEGTIGNTVGAYDFSGQVELDQLSIRFYKHYLIEAGASIPIRSNADGIFGLQLIRKKTSGLINGFVYEVINTLRQNSRNDLDEARGADNYYANFIYRSGWTHRQRVIGFPLVLTGEFRGINTITNNIIFAHNVALNGAVPIREDLPKLNYLLRFAYSINFGRTTDCSDDFCPSGGDNPLRFPRADQVYSSLELSYPWKENINLTGAFGLDTGELANNVALQLGVIYNLNR